MSEFKVRDERFKELRRMLTTSGYPIPISGEQIEDALTGYEERLVAAEKSRDDMTAESNFLLILMARIREAAGDPKGKLMQDELVEHIRNLAQKVGDV